MITHQRLLLLLCVLLLWLPGLAQTPNPETNSQPSLEKVESRLQEIERELAEIEPQFPWSPPEQANASQGQLETLRLTLERHRDVLKELESIPEETQKLAIEPLEFSTRPSFAEFDRGLDIIQQVEKELATADLTVSESQNSLKNSIQRSSDLKTQRRALLDRVNNETDASERVEARKQLASVELSLELAEANEGYDQSRLTLAKRRLEATQAKLALYQESIDSYREKVKFSKEYLEENLAELDEEKASLNERMVEAKNRQQERERLLQEAVVKSQLQPTNEELSAELQTREEWLKTSRLLNTTLDEGFELNLQRRRLWESRYKISTGETKGAQLRELSEELEVQWKSNTQSIELKRAQLDQLRTQESEQRGALEAQNSERVRASLLSQREALLAAESYHDEVISALLAHRRLLGRVRDEVRGISRKVPFAERFGAVTDSLRAVWNYELYSVGDSAVTVKKFVIAGMVLALGLFLSRRLVSFIKRRFLEALKIRSGAVTVIEKILYYLLVIFVFLFALQVVNIPLTVFTFLGGSLAIAVGFGAQNILNNFISGLILMIEQPVNVGDMIEVGGMLGEVEEIGARSTRVKRYTGTHIVVPNSSLLENTVINWTLQNKVFRTQVNVGVAYGSDVELVFEQIGAALKQTEGVRNDPPPDILFSDFGDNTLGFEVHFWVRATRPMQKRRIESDFRCQIDKLFRAADIEISFPQRDVHLDTLKPLEVRLVSNTMDADSSEESGEMS